MQPKQREQILRGRIQLFTWLFIVGLVLSGLSAIPLQTELDMFARWLQADNVSPDETASAFTKWVLMVRNGLHDTYTKYPFMAYGTDWLGFAHFLFAVAFVGAVRHPVRNAWLYQFGMIACVLVLPWALLMGELRGIPLFWRLIDCSFGIVGFIPCWLCQKWTAELQQLVRAAAANP